MWQVSFGKKRSNFFGYTLIELIVVIAIIGILLGAGYTIFADAQKSARDGKRVEDILEIQKALEQYFSLTKTYPISLNSIKSYFQNSIVPQDPQGDLSPQGIADYPYVKCSTSEKYIVCTKPEVCANLNCNSSVQGTDTEACNGNSTNSGSDWFCAVSLSN